jgi:hypothetical protein
MKLWKKFTLFAAVICIIFSFSNVNVLAAETNYTYTVTIRAAGDATFDENSIRDNIRVTKVTDTADGQIETAYNNVAITWISDGKTVMISGIGYGDRVLIEGTHFIGLPDDSKYYIKGVRISGQDVDTPSFEVTKDTDLVVSYGVAGNMVEYTVNYLDTDGNVCAESASYYGRIGDKPVISYRYIDGYVPQAYNLTKTLVENAADNVFNFVYAPQSTTSYAYNTVVEDTPEETPAEATPETVEEPPAGGADDNTYAQIEDEDVPQGAQELVDLDDEEVPLAGGGSKATAEQAFTKKTAIIAGIIAVVAVAGIISAVYLGVKHRKVKNSR